MNDEFDPQSEAKRLMRTALVGSLATLDSETGGPSASMVAVANDMDGAPLLLISQLAMHTKNLQSDDRASLLLDERSIGIALPESGDDPMTRSRVSLTGRFSTTDDARVRARFLSTHPDAAMYADFGDFAFWKLTLQSAYLVAGFGRIHSIKPQRLLTDLADKQPLIEAEPEIVAHLNEDHADTLVLYARDHAASSPGFDPENARCVTCDPEGLVLRSGMSLMRIAFPQSASTPGDVRKALKALAVAARTNQM